MIFRGRGGQSEPSALRAIAHLVHIGMVECRSMISTRDVLAPGPDADPNSPEETEYLPRIKMIVEICQDFTRPFMESDPAEQERSAAGALSWRWSVSPPAARRWLTSRLAQLGPEYTGLLKDPSD